MKVLHIISNLMSGGAETMLSKVAQASASMSVDHVVISMLSGGRIADELTQAGIPVRSLGSARSLGAITHINALRRMVRDIQPDLIQAWMYHGNIAATGAAILNGTPSCPVIWNVRQTVRRLRDETVLTACTILAGGLISRMPTAIVYNSKDAATAHERLGFSRERRIIIANGFDTAIFRPNPNSRNALLSELQLAGDAELIGRIANFHPRKDFASLIAAFATISRENHRAHLILAGRDVSPQNQNLTRLIETLPSPGNVHLLGERRDVAQLMPAFDLLLSSSLIEGFPNVIGEAMACGVVTVATDAGDCRDILGDRDRIVPLGDSSSLAQKALAILSLDREQRARIGARDRARVISEYSIEKIAAEYVRLWRREAGKE